MTDTHSWSIPHHTVTLFQKKKTQYCLCIPVINEGIKFVRQLKQLKGIAEDIDIIVLDGGSSDGSTDSKLLKSHGVRGILTKADSGKLSSQLRIGYAFALQEGYKGIITIDGNGKDRVEDVYTFITALDEGFDFVQGSRFVKNGRALNTPLSRYLAIRLIHAPLISLAARHWFTDTTNGFRGYSSRYLRDRRVQPFRTVFQTYELLAYLSVRASQLQMKVTEVPVTRSYPKGIVPTKITAIRGSIDLIVTLVHTVFGKYHPHSN